MHAWRAHPENSYGEKLVLRLLAGMWFLAGLGIFAGIVRLDTGDKQALWTFLTSGMAFLWGRVQRAELTRDSSNPRGGDDA